MVTARKLTIGSSCVSERMLELVRFVLKTSTELFANLLVLLWVVLVALPGLRATLLGTFAATVSLTVIKKS